MTDDTARRRQAVTELLVKAGKGDTAAAELLMEQVYPDLKKMAAAIFRSERPGHTLQPTALVNEAYMRTFGATAIDWRDRAHFFALMSRVLRRVLVDHARAVRAEKRGAGAVRIALDDMAEPMVSADHDYFDLDDALESLAREDPRAARVVELRFFGGLKESEVAEVLGISMPTVTRDWRFARTWLLARLVDLPPAPDAESNVH